MEANKLTGMIISGIVFILLVSPYRTTREMERLHCGEKMFEEGFLLEVSPDCYRDEVIPPGEVTAEVISGSTAATKTTLHFTLPSRILNSDF